MDEMSLCLLWKAGVARPSEYVEGIAGTSGTFTEEAREEGRSGIFDAREEGRRMEERGVAMFDRDLRGPV